MEPAALSNDPECAEVIVRRTLLDAPAVAFVTDREGFWERPQLVERYAERSGIDVGHLDVCIVLSGLKLAVIMESIRKRTLAGQQLGADTSLADGMAMATDALAAMGLAVASGGGVDALARLLARKLQADLGETVLVENKPGAGGNLGLDFVAAAPPDGRTLASAGPDGAIRLWDVAAHTKLGTLEGHRGAATRLVFSLDGRTLFSASVDQTIRVWDLERQRLAAVEGPVREQFESDLRALTDAEQDSKELKSAKRSLLFERIIEGVHRLAEVIHQEMELRTLFGTTLPADGNTGIITPGSDIV